MDRLRQRGIEIWENPKYSIKPRSFGAGPRSSTHEAGISPRHADGDGLSGVTSDVGGMSLT
jgi:hypothetical protein